jgi:hypothetical protein
MKLKKIIKNQGTKSKSTQVNSTNPPHMAYDQDKKKLNLQKKSLTNKIKVK